MYKKITILAVITLISDQLSKLLIEANIHLNEAFTIIDDFFWLRYTNNYGAAWGVFSERTFLLVGVSLVAILVLIRYINTFSSNKRNIYAFGILLGGITGNLLDRLFLGYVRDFLSFNIFGYKFPVFNLADIAIFIGVTLLIYAIIKGEDDGSKSKPKSKKNR